MLYAACIPGFLIVVGMQFAVESPRWLAKVTSIGVQSCYSRSLFTSESHILQVGRFDDARKVVESLWEPSEVDKSMEEIKAVVANDDSQSSWSELLVEPHNRGSSIHQNMLFFLALITAFMETKGYHAYDLDSKNDELYVYVHVRKFACMCSWLLNC